MEINGWLEVDLDRGVLYFHSFDPEVPTPLRVCGLPKPIPVDFTHIDVTVGVGASIERG